MEKTNTTIYVKPDLWNAFRMDCLKENISASGKVSELIESYLRDKRLFDVGASHDLKSELEKENTEKEGWK